MKRGVYSKADIKTTKEGAVSLVLKNKWTTDLLPNVSVVTITKNRLDFVGIMLYNWNHFNYTPEKLEWVIVDDSDTDELSSYLPLDDPRINYIHLKEPLPVDKKRNLAVSHTKYDYIVHMDDDDYYFPDSIITKICVLLEYKKSGVHSMPMAVYDLIENKSFVFDCYPSENKHTNAISEASIAYKKSYWEKHPFRCLKNKNGAEGTPFIGDRFNEWILIPYYFNTISITHNKNMTQNARRPNASQPLNTSNFKDVFFPDLFNMVLNNIKQLIFTPQLLE